VAGQGVAKGKIMVNLRVWPAVLAACALAACQPAPPVDAGAAPNGFGVDACGAAELQDMVGQPKTVLAVMKFAVPVRVIEPGTPITADFMPNRLNFELGADGRIARIGCY
jgi:hypothetical protein